MMSYGKAFAAVLVVYMHSIFPRIESDLVKFVPILKKHLSKQKYVI